MIRGANSKFKFDLPCNFSDLKGDDWLNIVFWQEENDGIEPYGTLPVIKTLAQCKQGSKPNQVVVTLYQGETLRFSHDRKGYVQLMGMHADEPITSLKKIFTVYSIYSDDIVNALLPTPSDEDWIYLDGQDIE